MTLKRPQKFGESRFQQNPLVQSYFEPVCWLRFAKFPVDTWVHLSWPNITKMTVTRSCQIRYTFFLSIYHGAKFSSASPYTVKEHVDTKNGKKNLEKSEVMDSLRLNATVFSLPSWKSVNTCRDRTFELTHI